MIERRPILNPAFSGESARHAAPLHSCKYRRLRAPQISSHPFKHLSPDGDPATASADQQRMVWGPFVEEAGTFEVSGNNTVTMQERREEFGGDEAGRFERLFLPTRGRPVDPRGAADACWPKR